MHFQPGTRAPDDYSIEDTGSRMCQSPEQSRNLPVFLSFALLASRKSLQPRSLYTKAKGQTKPILRKYDFRKPEAMCKFPAS